MCTIYCFFRLPQTFEHIKKQKFRVLIALSANIKSQGLLFSLRKIDTKKMARQRLNRPNIHIQLQKECMESLTSMVLYQVDSQAVSLIYNSSQVGIENGDRYTQQRREIK